MKDVEFADLQHCILLRDRLVTKVETRATLCFNLQCNDVARQVEEKCYPYYRTLIPPTINPKIKPSNDFKYVNKIKSPDKNIAMLVDELSFVKQRKSKVVKISDFMFTRY